MKKIYTLLFLAFSTGLFNLCVAQYDTIASFTGAKGGLPFGALTLSVNKNVLYGMTSARGTQNYGCIFSIDTNGERYNDIHNFDSVKGSVPYGSLTLMGNKLYGMTSAGGLYDSGCIFSIDTNGGNYKDLLDLNYITGSCPRGSLILSANKLYGMTLFGGTYGAGVLFSVDTNGSQYKHILNFNGVNGAVPSGSLLLSGVKLFGMTEGGGVNDSGNVFTIDTNGNNYEDIHDFDGPDGSIPQGSLALSGKVLYGMTLFGGTYHDGCVFSVDTNGNSFKDMMNFSLYLTGAWPEGDLTVESSHLYGMYSSGGVGASLGGIFCMDTNGTDYHNLYAFDPINPFGENPTGSLTPGLPGIFFGMTNSGGLYNSGVIFNLQSCINNYTEPICVITVDTATDATEIIWGRTNSPPAGGYGYYRLYKDTLSIPHEYEQQPLDSLSEFIDTAGSASASWGPLSFQLSTIDSCGESVLSPILTSIFLTVSPGVGVFILNWTAYNGFTPTEYRIFRKVTPGPFLQIDSVPNSVLTFRDTLPPAGSIYAVEAVNPGSCIPSTHRPSSHNFSTPAISGAFSNELNSKLAGIKNIGNTVNNVKIYPNPSRGIFTVQSSVFSNSSTLEVYNVLGENVITETTPHVTNTIDLSSRPNGVYFYRVLYESGELIGEGKIVIQK